jgi:hypothetical protein
MTLKFSYTGLSDLGGFKSQRAATWDSVRPIVQSQDGWEGKTATGAHLHICMCHHGSYGILPSTGRHARRRHDQHQEGGSHA